jgi:hypothetical protein
MMDREVVQREYKINGWRFNSGSVKFDRFYNLSCKLCFLVVFEYKYYFNKCYCLVAHTELKTGFACVLISV